MLQAKDRISYVSLERGDRSNFRTRITCAASGRVPGSTASAARTRTYFLVRPNNARFGAEIRTLLNGYGGVLASSCHPLPERRAGSGPSRAVHMSSRTCGAAASLGRAGTRRPKRQRSSGDGMISSALRRT